MKSSKKELLETINPERLKEILAWLISLRSEAVIGTEQKIAEEIQCFLQKLGYEAEIDNDSDGVHPNVVLRIPGKLKRNKKTISYLGHIDTVAAGDEKIWSYSPFHMTEVKGKWYGRGCADMKGSIACILYFLELVKRLKITFDQDFLVFFDADEESHNIGLKRLLEKKWNVDFILVGEPTNLQIHLGHRGVMAFQIDISGKNAHAAKAKEGINALYGAAALMNHIREKQHELEKVPNSYLGAGGIQCTTLQCDGKVNMIPAKAKMMVDRRLTTGETKEKAIREMEEMVQKAQTESGCTFHVTVTTCCPAGFCSEKVTEVAVIKKNIYEITGKKAKLSCFEASCEAGMVSEQWKAPALIFGPGSIDQAHTVDEFVERRQMEIGMQLYTGIFCDLLGLEGD